MVMIVNLLINVHLSGGRCPGAVGLEDGAPGTQPHREEVSPGMFMCFVCIYEVCMYVCTSSLL